MLKVDAVRITVPSTVNVHLSSLLYTKLPIPSSKKPFVSSLVFVMHEPPCASKTKRELEEGPQTVQGSAKPCYILQVGDSEQ